MTRTFEEKKRILELWQEGCNKLQIAKETGSSRNTIKDCHARYGSIAELEQKSLEDKLSGEKVCVCDTAAWTMIFPQHGIAPKNLRKIELEDWQPEVVDKYLLEFFREPYHSDGCSHFNNIVKGQDYPKYQLTNMSDDNVY